MNHVKGNRRNLFFIRVYRQGPFLFFPVRGVEVIKFLVHGLFDVNRIKMAIHPSKVLFLAFRELIRFDKALIRGFSWFIGASEFSIEALFGFKLHHRLEEILKES